MKLKITHYLKFKIVYNSGKSQIINGYDARSIHKSEIDDLRDGIIEIIKSVFRDGDTGIISMADKYVNLKEVSFIEIKQKTWIW